MALTIIISYYKALDNLKVILSALTVQSNKNFEVIISEDDYNISTINWLKDNKQIYNFAIHHLNQNEDNGFRKNSMLNKSIMYAKTEMLAFIDGDCVPHKHFVKEYSKNEKEGCLLSGRSVMMGESISNKIRKHLSVEKLTFLSVLFTDSKSKKEGVYFPPFYLSTKQKGLIGRNWGVLKKHLIAVNGFDEDYVLAGVGEDVDIEWRLLASGLKLVSLKNKAIIFHLYHPRSYSEDGVQKNYKLLQQKMKLNNIKCLNGIEKL